MPHPIALCLEDLDVAPDQPRYRRCTAIGGRAPGLRIDPGGNVQWQTDVETAAELWVSADERLVLFRPEGGAPVTLQRGSRRLELQYGKPVFVLDQDEILIGPRRLSLYVHGVAQAVMPPTWLPPRALASAAAAALALGVLVVGCENNTAPANHDKIEVRNSPPLMIPPKPPSNAPPVSPNTTNPPPIEVRDAPPKPPPPSTDE